MAGIVGLTELQHTNGNSMLTVATTGDGNVKSEGGAATTSLRQGLAKAWAYIDGTGTVALRESFNIGSLTDTAVGKYTTNLTNSMSSANYSIPSGGHYYPVGNPISQGESHQTFPMDSNTIQSNTGNGSAFQDNEGPAHSVFGDLA